MLVNFVFMHEIRAVSASTGKVLLSPITAAEAETLAEMHPGFGISGERWTFSRAGLPEGVRFFIGVGPGLETPGDYREFGAQVSRLKLDVDIELKVDSAPEALATLEGLRLGGYEFNRYRSKPVASKTIFLVTSSNTERSDVIAKHTNLARDLINTPANDLWPARFAEISRELAGSAVKVEVWAEDRLEAERCGGLLGVGQGSARPPRLVKLSYGSGGQHFSLVGKGITFDTGGLSIKPAEGMVGMKYDMAGAATALAATLALAELGANVRVDAYLCLAENMPSGTATRPGDVIRARNGKTIEVLNTDAEGRLVMADGLSLASETNPDHIIDVATLTGAATIALGNRYAGLMGTGEVVGLLEKAAEATGELLWQMPLPEELRKLLDSDIADIANVKIGNRAGGMLIAGQFLKEFVTHESGSWAHLDIAGPANNAAAPYSVNPAGATGVMVRTLIETLDASGR
jgi:leucyl aminopeptidase